MTPILREAQDEGQLSGSPVQFPGAKNLQKLNLRDHKITHVIKPRGESAKPRIWFFFVFFVFLFDYFLMFLIIFCFFLSFRFDSFFFWFFGLTFFCFLIFNFSSNIGRERGIVTVQKTRRAWSKRGHDFKKQCSRLVKNCTTCAPTIVINLWSYNFIYIDWQMGNSGYSAGSPPHATARGKGWVSKMDADTKEGNTDDECCDRTEGGGLQNGVFFGCYHCLRCQGSNHRTSEDDWGVQFSSEMPAGKQCEQWQKLVVYTSLHGPNPSNGLGGKPTDGPTGCNRHHQFFFATGITINLCLGIDPKHSIDSRCLYCNPESIVRRGSLKNSEDIPWKVSCHLKR